MTPGKASQSHWVTIRPHDTVHVRDGRTMLGGEGGSAHSVNPWPSTVAGTFKTVLGAEPETVAGPITARRDGDAWVPYFSTPLDLVATPRSLWRMDLPPRRLGASDLDDMFAGENPRHLRLPGHLNDAPVKPDSLGGVISGDDLQNYLHGNLEQGEELSLDDLDHYDDPVHEEERIGVGLDSTTRTVKDGMLYQVVHRRLDEDWAFAACFHGGRALPPTGQTVRFGGLSRLADVEPAELAWPEPPMEYPEGQVLIYLVTPGVWEHGWLPPLPDNAQLVAAKVDDPMPVASASPRHKNFYKTRTLAWSVPPGSVYFLKFPDSRAAAEWAAAHHGRALSPAARPRWDTAGFGIILTGVWS